MTDNSGLENFWKKTGLRTDDSKTLVWKLLTEILAMKTTDRQFWSENYWQKTNNRKPIAVNSGLKTTDMS